LFSTPYFPSSTSQGRSKAYRTRNLLVTFGDDFKFQRAEHQFSNMDSLIGTAFMPPVLVRMPPSSSCWSPEHINSGNFGVKIKYATLSEVRVEACLPHAFPSPIFHVPLAPSAHSCHSTLMQSSQPVPPSRSTKETFSRTPTIEILTGR